MRVIRSLALSLCFFPLWMIASAATESSAIAAQQLAAAVLAGRVVDPAGAAIVGVKVIARHKATGVSSETSTNDRGLYALANLPLGEYEVRARASGFAESIYESVVLQVGQTTTLDIVARVKGVEERVTIAEAATPLINTTSATIDSRSSRWPKFSICLT